MGFWQHLCFFKNFVKSLIKPRIIVIIHNKLQHFYILKCVLDVSKKICSGYTLHSFIVFCVISQYTSFKK